MSLLEWAVVLFAVTFSAIIKNSVGVGAGIFMLPVMAMVLPAKLALGLGAPAMLISDAVGCVSYYKQWRMRSCFPFAGSSIRHSRRRTACGCRLPDDFS